VAQARTQTAPIGRIEDIGGFPWEAAAAASARILRGVHAVIKGKIPLFQPVRLTLRVSV
jgi:hypothetical protein